VRWVAGGWAGRDGWADERKTGYGKKERKKEGGERWTDGVDSRRRGDGLAGLYGPATCCRGRLKEKEIDRGRWDLGQGREEADLG
jgi:hypothetical protein